jgi:hypothetical protein
MHGRRYQLENIRVAIPHLSTITGRGIAGVTAAAVVAIILGVAWQAHNWSNSNNQQRIDKQDQKADGNGMNFGGNVGEINRSQHSVRNDNDLRGNAGAVIISAGTVYAQDLATGSPPRLRAIHCIGDIQFSWWTRNSGEPSPTLRATLEPGLRSHTSGHDDPTVLWYGPSRSTQRITNASMDIAHCNRRP